MGDGSSTRSSVPGTGGAGVGRRSGLEVSVPGVGRRPDGLRRDRSHYPAHEAGSGSGPPRHRRPRPGVRETSGDRGEAPCGLYLRYPVPFPGTGPQRASQRPGAPILPEGDRLPPGDGSAGTDGGGPAPPSASEGPGIPHPGRGLCPWVGSPTDAGRGTRPAVRRRTRHSGPSGDSPERLRSASRFRVRPCMGQWLRSGSPAVEIGAIRGRKTAFEARIFRSPPRYPSLRATPSFRDRSAVALRNGSGD